VLNLLHDRAARKDDADVPSSHGKVLHSYGPLSAHAHAVQLLIGGVLLVGVCAVLAGRFVNWPVVAVLVAVGLAVLGRELATSRRRALVTDTSLVLRSGRSERVWPHGSYQVEVVHSPRTTGPA